MSQNADAEGGASLRGLLFSVTLIVGLIVVLFPTLYGSYTAAPVSYGERVWMAFVTVSTIGYGDFLVCSPPTEYQETAVIYSHPDWVWLSWTLALLHGIAAWGLLYETTADYLVQSREVAELEQHHQRESEEQETDAETVKHEVAAERTGSPDEAELVRNLRAQVAELTEKLRIAQRKAEAP